MPETIRLGPDTISRLEMAARARLGEAVFLADGGHHLAAIYLAGYATEMTIGAAYFEAVRRFGRNKGIDKLLRKEILIAARSLSHLEDKSHPIDGLARYFIREKILRRPPGFDEKLAAKLVSRVEEICQYWAPGLRDRPIEAKPQQSGLVLETTRWIVENCPHH